MDSTQLKELGCLYADNVLLLVEGGSKLRGAKLEGADAQIGTVSTSSLLLFRKAEVRSSTLRSLFFARNHVKQFLGYVESPLKRLYNERSKDVNRALPSPEAPQAHIFLNRIRRWAARCA